MPSIAETAYPRLKSHVTDKELQEIYTPSQRELQFAKQQTRRGLTQLGLLVQLKTFQRLGYFVSCQEVPIIIIKHTAQCSQSVVPSSALAQYDKSRNRWRHVKLIRDYLNVKPHGQTARPTKQTRYQHIDGLFSSVADWELIETHLPDMLRVALSIKAGKFTASTILRKLGTYSRKNRLYQAFRGWDEPSALAFCWNI